ncbi:MAG TPA: polysaccharide biosynthesis/export family protein [Rhizobiaceae bacterium]|nr:polysaccharide biosynthesis/export family protein [Rhizobiaceae bacterium]
MLLVFSIPAQADEYRLGTMDKLDIRVAEWQTAQGSVRNWQSINGAYTVGPSGDISLPFLGQMPVAGKSTGEVAAEIGQQLQQKFGLIDKPAASVEIAEFRPVFVSGDVQTPGRYPYLPGLTVLKAISLAGGMRQSDALSQRFLRDFINARGNYQVLIAQRNSLLAASARLAAEAQHQSAIDFPKEVKNSPDGQKLMADETAFKEAREKKLTAQLKSLADLKGLLQKEVTSLAEKMDNQNHQIALTQQELSNVSALAKKGLAVNQRSLTLEEQIAELQGKLLDMETAQLRAKQGISQADQDSANLQNDRDSEIAQDRQQDEAELRAVALKLSMYKDLMAEAVESSPATINQSVGSNTLSVNYSIVRTQNGKSQEMPADENTPVQPGDVVKVVTKSIPLGSD